MERNPKYNSRCCDEEPIQIVHHCTDQWRVTLRCACGNCAVFEDGDTFEDTQAKAVEGWDGMNKSGSDGD
jgi:hypothetical protein